MPATKAAAQPPAAPEPAPGHDTTQRIPVVFDAVTMKTLNEADCSKNPILAAAISIAKACAASSVLKHGDRWRIEIPGAATRHCHVHAEGAFGIIEATSNPSDILRAMRPTRFQFVLGVDDAFLIGKSVRLFAHQNSVNQPAFDPAAGTSHHRFSPAAWSLSDANITPP